MGAQTFNTTEEHGHKFEQAVVPVSAPVWDELFKASAVSGGTISKVGDLEGTSAMQLVVGAVGNTAPGDTLTIKFYLDRERTMQYGSDVLVVVPTVATEKADSIAVSFTAFDYVKAYSVTGTITSTAGLTDLRIYLVKLPLV